MSLTSGTQLGSYEIVAPLGAGGMGEVYRARDPRLNRDVAIKVLPDIFASDPERLARFQREAQMLAALNHSNIAAIYGLEEAAGKRFLVLELVPGETLAQYLTANGALPAREVLDIARQLGEALEAAHEKGIIHRDLKPANIKLTPEGKVKVLDFGLAKAFATDASGGQMTNSPTLSMAATRAGVLLGTAAYMSPEQARGKSLDRRTDVWAFGCVMFELLTGIKAFDGDTVSDAVAVILTRDPDWAKLPETVPHRLRELLRRCLTKDASHRLRDMGDARIELEEMLADSASGLHPAPTILQIGAAPRTFWTRPVALWRAASALLVVILAATVIWLNPRKPAASTSLIRTFLATPEGKTITGQNQPMVAISSDSQYVAFAAGKGPSSQLYLRKLDQTEAAPIPGSENGTNPFFSPDGQWIGFISGGKLRKVPISGGTAIPLCDASEVDARGANWGDDGKIYIVPNFLTGVFSIPESGGSVQPVTTPDSKAGERTHRWPELLPGGKALLYTVGSVQTPDYYFEAQLVVKSLVTGQSKVLVNGGTNPHFLRSGFLLYSTASGLRAAPFDSQKLELTGPPVALTEQISTEVGTGAMHYAVSPRGDLVYIQGEPPNPLRSLIWKDSSGKIERLPAPPQAYYDPVLSPDGKRVALTIGSTRNDDIWVLDIARNVLTRLTLEASSSANGPAWSPDGVWINYTAERNKVVGIYRKRADGSGTEEMVVAATTTAPQAFSFSPDGKTLILTQVDPYKQNDIFQLSLEGDRKLIPVISSDFNEDSPALSPDGRWLAYTSDESGNSEVYVQAFPGPGGKWQVSAGGGVSPQWSSDGKALYYRIAGAVNRVEVNTKPAFSISQPKMAFPGPFGGFRPFAHTLYSITPDTKRLLTVEPSPQDAGTDRINLVLGWGDEVKRLAATVRK